MKGGGAIVMHAAARKQVPKSKTSFFLYILLLYVLLPVLVLYVVALAVSPFYSRPCPQDGGAGDVARLAAAADGKWHNNSSSSSTSVTRLPPPKARPKPKASADDDAAPTGLRHIVFGIGASSSLWKSRREYIRVWWRPGEMRGFVWLDKPVPELYSRNASSGLPGIKNSGNTSRFPCTHGAGSRSALRITRIVSESFRLGLPGARWFVMGDDDTVFFPDNLAESHIQNLIFSYGMAFGGGGFAISRTLAAQLARIQDGCIERYPALYGSDDRIHACMSELGVPLTRHLGFHQCDLWGDVLGLLGAHPVAPLVSLHHFDFLQPVFPTVRSRTQALRRLFAGPVALDPAAVAQQSVCYDAGKEWTVSVSWGVRGGGAQRGAVAAVDGDADADAGVPQLRPQVYYMRQARLERCRRNRNTTTVTEYERHGVPPAPCRWRIPDPAALLDRVVVLKKPDPEPWKRAPRRNCCRVVSSPTVGKDRRMTIDVGVCRDGEFARVFRQSYIRSPRLQFAQGK
ncbi:unnamed protein product [Miscanthus lutarioriparius]|uniref:Uncharacterized protein n=1 Tax=Miscanthus lutarioriparius TaxID=422564 RepID=A0A811MLH2_9POAL|nr:unnamed protein product [Miscanthus lutarioriparius]